MAELTRRDALKLASGVGAMSAAGVLGAAAAGPAAAQSWHSELVYPGPDGRLVYEADGNGNRIPDFSYAGYRNSEAPLPQAEAVRSIGPVAGDNTEHIQRAIDEVGQLPLGDDGIRGAVLLEPGQYDVAGTIVINRSGVVLRGSGQQINPEVNSIITGTGPGTVSTVIRVEGTSDDWVAQVPGTRTDIIDDRVQVGSRRFTVADASGLSVGDNVIIFHPHTQEWIDAIDGGGVREQPPWPVGERPIMYNRYIREIEGNDITICAPVFDHLDGSLSQSYVYVWDNVGLLRNVGVERLRIDMGYPPSGDEDHPQTGIRLTRVEDAWVRDCTILHFSFAGIDCTRATRITIQDVQAAYPRSQRIGTRRYHFNASTLSNQILFRGLRAVHARHAFVASGTTRSSGHAWVDGFSEDGYSESGGHHRWSQGLLFDNIRELSNNGTNGWVLSLHNRGDIGTGQGWSSVHSVAWNCTVDSGKHVCVQQPPTAQNYAIGTTGAASGDNWNRRSMPAGHIEGTNRPGLAPGSLFQAQLADRFSSGRP